MYSALEEEALKGRSQGFGIWAGRYRKALSIRAAAKPGSVDDAQDIVQELLKVAYLNLSSLHGSGKVRIFREGAGVDRTGR